MPDMYDFYVEGGHTGTIIGMQIHHAGHMTDVPMSVETARVIGTLLLSHVAALGGR